MVEGAQGTTGVELRVLLRYPEIDGVVSDPKTPVAVVEWWKRLKG